MRKLVFYVSNLVGNCNKVNRKKKGVSKQKTYKDYISHPPYSKPGCSPRCARGHSPAPEADDLQQSAAGRAGEGLLPHALP